MTKKPPQWQVTLWTVTTRNEQKERCCADGQQARQLSESGNGISSLSANLVPVVMWFHILKIAWQVLNDEEAD